MTGCRAYMTILTIACACACSSCGPHMISQPSIHPYQKEMPRMPGGTVPTRGSLRGLETSQAQSGTNPAPATARNTRNGSVYYGYYCLMCHGENGDGNGPVGQSYVPKPTDLSSARVTGLSDAELYRRMLHGVGHDPVLAQTVIPEHRWPLIRYVRTFAGGGKGRQ